MHTYVAAVMFSMQLTGAPSLFRAKMSAKCQSNGSARDQRQCRSCWHVYLGGQRWHVIREVVHHQLLRVPMVPVAHQCVAHLQLQPLVLLMDLGHDLLNNELDLGLWVG